jgi:hypothetical protein
MRQISRLVVQATRPGESPVQGARAGGGFEQAGSIHAATNTANENANSNARLRFMRATVMCSNVARPQETAP